jgi:pimeloyl-ACP methyl ester carboxylesterase
MTDEFEPLHRGGSGPPLVCLHGFTATWRAWDLVLPALQRRHDVLAVTLAGHAGGPPLGGEASGDAIVDAVERAMDDAGFELAHIAGNSLGGHIALRLAERGRARSVVALAPAGGWAAGDDSYHDVLDHFVAMERALNAALRNADAILASPAGRRLATQHIVERCEHIPAELLAHQLVGAAEAPAALALIEYARHHPWQLDAARIACPVRIVWGTEDALLPWPSAAARYENDWLPHADWVILDGAGHAPQLDVPLEAAQLILGHTSE